MDYDIILGKLKNSKFRSSFHLAKEDVEYTNKKGLPIIQKHAEEILEKRIKIKPKNDERQTPWKGHPVFIAQHATATCCRKCLEQWHHIPKDKILSDEEIEFFAGLIKKWISTQIENDGKV